MQTDKSSTSLSPLGRDLLSIGKFFKPNRHEQLNPEATGNHFEDKKSTADREKSPVSVAINTSRAPPSPAISKYSINENEVRPITHMNIKQQPNPIASKSHHPNPRPIRAQEANEQQTQSRKQLREQGRYPSVVDFPTAYQYDQQQQLPETPDLPNRTKPSQKSPIKEQNCEVGVIKHQMKSKVFSNSAPKDFGVGKLNDSQMFQSSSPQLPYINKIETNIYGFRKFMKQPSFNSSAQISYKNDIGTKYQTNASLNLGTQPLRRKSVAKNIGEIVKKMGRLDPEEQQKLEQKKNFRISANNFHGRLKLPTFREENMQEFEQQVDLDRPTKAAMPTTKMHINQPNQLKPKLISETNPLGNSFINCEEECEWGPETLFSNSFIKNTAEGVRAEDVLIIDLRTSIQKIKQALIEGGQWLSAAFNIPEAFYHPPCSASTSQELHTKMLEVFSMVGINPQIVSIKKYINCVVMREKKLCIVWNFSGKIYFGGWKKEQTLAEGNKHGIGVEWVPSRYIYYGEFKDNKKEGYGIMKKSSKEIYIGCWKNNQRWGWGKVYGPSGDLHQNGQFIEGCFIYPQKAQVHVDAQGNRIRHI